MCENIFFYREYFGRINFSYCTYRDYRFGIIVTNCACNIDRNIDQVTNQFIRYLCFVNNTH